MTKTRKLFLDIFIKFLKNEDDEVFRAEKILSAGRGGERKKRETIVLRQARICGVRPKLLSPLTLCWVGFVFCSPTTLRTGTKLTCIRQKFPAPDKVNQPQIKRLLLTRMRIVLWGRNIILPTRYENWPSASMKGMDSISPMVPPNSMTQTSGGPSFPSTGTAAARSIQSWMASVMWGTT